MTTTIHVPTVTDANNVPLSFILPPITLEQATQLARIWKGKVHDYSYTFSGETELLYDFTLPDLLDEDEINDLWEAQRDNHKPDPKYHYAITQVTIAAFAGTERCGDAEHYEICDSEAPVTEYIKMDEIRDYIRRAEDSGADLVWLEGNWDYCPIEDAEGCPDFYPGPMFDIDIWECKR